MDYISQLQDIGAPTVLAVILLLLFALPTIGHAVADFVSFFGIETKWSKREKDELDAIQHMQEEIEEIKICRQQDREESQKIRKQINDNQDMLCDKFDALQKMVVYTQISSYRHQILDFANAVMNGRDYNKEIYDNILIIYDDYERIIEKYDIKNGLVEASMDFVNKKYQELLAKGFKY